MLHCTWTGDADGVLRCKEVLGNGVPEKDNIGKSKLRHAYECKTYAQSIRCTKYLRQPSAIKPLSCLLFTFDLHVLQVWQSLTHFWDLFECKITFGNIPLTVGDWKKHPPYALYHYAYIRGTIFYSWETLCPTAAAASNFCHFFWKPFKWMHISEGRIHPFKVTEDQHIRFDPLFLSDPPHEWLVKQTNNRHRCS